VESAIEERGPWTEHVQARVRPLLELDDRASVEALASVRTRLAAPQPVGGELDVWDKQARHLVFGPRWNVTRALYVGRGEALALLSLDPRFVADSKVFQIHPALFDFATASALAALDGYGACPDFFVPFAYERVRAAALGTAVWAHSRIRSGIDASSSVTLADVTIYAEAGEVVAVVEGFAMRRLASGRLAADRSAARASDGSAPTPASLTARLIEQGVRSDEGAVAFERVLSTRLGPQVVLSPVDPAALSSAVDRVYPPRRPSAGSTKAARPAAAADRGLDTIEQAIAEMWEELLGVREVGLDDDFFALGGHSLTALRLTTRLEKAFGAGLRVSTVFEAPTIRRLADRIRSVAVGEPGLQPVDRIVESSEKSAERSLPPLVAVARDAFRVDRSTWAEEDEEGQR
jgi:acyl carrier protein